MKKLLAIPVLAAVALTLLLIYGERQDRVLEKESEILGFEIRDTLVDMGKKTPPWSIEATESFKNADGSIDLGFHLFKRSESNVVNDIADKNPKTICYAISDAWYISIDTPDGRLSFQEEVSYDDCQSPLKHLRHPMFLGGDIEKQLMYLRLIKEHLKKVVI